MAGTVLEGSAVVVDAADVASDVVNSGADGTSSPPAPPQRPGLTGAGLPGGRLPDDRCRRGLRGRDVTGVQDLLALGLGGDEDELEPSGQGAPDDGGLNGVGPTRDELIGTGRFTVVGPGVNRLIEVPGGPCAVLTNAQVDAHALGKVRAAGPGEARNEEAVHLKRIGQEGGIGLRVGRSGKDGADRTIGRQRRECRDAVVAT